MRLDIIGKDSLRKAIRVMLVHNRLVWIVSPHQHFLLDVLLFIVNCMFIGVVILINFITIEAPVCTPKVAELGLISI